MKVNSLPSLLLLCLLTISLSTCKTRETLSAPEENTSPETGIAEALRSLGLSVREISNDHSNSHISSTYELMISQPIDHNDKSIGYFQQKFFLSYVSAQAPMVMYLSGYNANNNRYLSEPCAILSANQIHVEHRFFGDSSPEKVPYEYLSIEQAAADHNHIVRTLKKIFKGPWVTTGISKGGQTTMYHRFFYPDDVEASLVYVAPLNQDLEDNRIYDFLENVGEESCRNRVLAFQIELLLNYNQALSFFEEQSAEQGYRYTNSLEEAFELSVFEYGFAFWQWSADCDAIPSTDSSIEEKINHLFTIDAPGFFTESAMTEIFPFFYQSYSEMGMYGYKVGAFAGLTQEYVEDFSNYRTFIPESFDIEYNGSVHAQVEAWLDSDAEDMVFIYGEYDPWSATGYDPKGSNNLFRFTVPEGNHASRLAHLSEPQIRQFKDSLYTWIQLKEEN